MEVLLLVAAVVLHAYRAWEQVEQLQHANHLLRLVQAAHGHDLQLPALGQWERVRVLSPSVAQQAELLFPGTLHLGPLVAWGRHLDLFRLLTAAVVHEVAG